MARRFEGDRDPQKCCVEYKQLRSICRPAQIKRSAQVSAIGSVGRVVLSRRLEEGDCGVVPSHEQQAKGPRTAVAGDSWGRFLQVDPFKGTVLIHQILNKL